MNLRRIITLAMILAPEGTDAPAGGTPAIPAAATPTAPAAAVTPAAPTAGEPEWLNGRIAQAKKSAEADLLKSLGFANADEAKKAGEAARKASEAEKTGAEKAAEFKTKLEAETAEKKRLADTVAEHAARMLMVLTPEQQKAVKDIAGDDSAAQLRAIGALQPTWVKARDEAAAATAAATKAAATAAGTTTTPAATTSPAPTAPAGTTTSPPNHRAAYQAMRSANPFAAAQYADEHPEAYDTPSG